MKILSVSLLCLGLLGATGVSQAAGNCTISLKGDDAMKFDLKTATVSAACSSITVELTHAGKLPAAAMGHNVVISATKDMDAIARDGIKAGVANNYVTKGDARVIAATTLVGGGEKIKVSFPGKKLTAGGDYTFFCSFPGHSMLMKGKLTVTK
ncbi:azurin [Lysobacter sp. S4-A87]|uniref:azurin n=1 Tax=Lysobacter sp. S4-A87 TaxID=2925843 RepID=UPI001F532CF5|nr:azurin [Lysobacter sp. S4-A87]UNK49416.1 azurin [Lysobacter sp. S4-A87]